MTGYARQCRRLGMVLALLGVAACTAGSTSVPTGRSRVVVVGDSITEAHSPDFDGGEIGPDSWAAEANELGATVVGGWAHAGATTADMIAGLQHGSIPAGDVLVVMAGNNDVDRHVPVAAIEDNLRLIAALVPGRRVVLSTLAPEDAVAPAVQAVNSRLPALARAEGWTLLDPMTAIRAPDGKYLPGMTVDGVHPTQRAAHLIALALQPALTG
ncbi:MAG TPA: SGNH/GDSL hydrolase family protein [Blastococcus sp.]|nr:SGNH/GDSL hydrolase family protein [Blastococcus sp.]